MMARTTSFKAKGKRQLSKLADFLGDMLDEIPIRTSNGYQIGATTLTENGTVTWGNKVTTGLIDLAIWQGASEGFEVSK